MIAPDNKVILLFTDWYTPGYKAGGPIQSCRNLVATLGNQYRFYIITSDRDLGEAQPFEGITRNEWVTGHKQEKILYASPEYIRTSKIRELINNVQPDIIYFNSMFSRRFTLLPLWTLKTMRFQGRVVLAPRGMLHAGAMMRKGRKKNIFLWIFSWSGWPRKLVFHATDQQERQDITRFFPTAQQIQIAGNIPAIDNNPVTDRRKTSGELRMVFISRVHPKKNLLFFLEILKGTDLAGAISFDIFGETDDPKYEAQCKELVQLLPGNIQVAFRGPLKHEEVFGTLHQYHLFVLPTHGENFGHAIFEALSSGTPVLISDQTPWHQLESYKAGWDLPLDQPVSFKTAISRMVAMDAAEYSNWSGGARSYTELFLSNFDFISNYTALFQ